MARLNEGVPAPLDPVELLRRKYSRQNKEIARVNSTQSVRIRNLENEISRLLTENLGLREQILRLQSEAEPSRSARFSNHVSETKSKIEEKLLEVSALVISLGGIPARTVERTPTKASMKESLNRTPDRKIWKNICTLSEAAGLEDGRLPPILEDKYYPRRTLEPAEFDAILSDPVSNNTDSPDIGPPPVSKFIDEDPVHIDLPNQVGVNRAESPEIDSSRSIHLERRRKRKDTTRVSENNHASKLESNSSFSTEVVQSLKTGSKRKLSTRDEEETGNNIKATETPPDELKFTKTTSDYRIQCKALEIRERSRNKTSREIVARVSREKAAENKGSNTRKALAPKSVNSDVANSPKPVAKPVLLDEVLSSKAFVLLKESKRESSRVLKQDYMLTSRESRPFTEAIDIHAEPETPAALDLVEPQSLESSIVHTVTRDTPPPTELGSGTEGQRPSRRSRGSVSYAEPNLRDKMRRQTKELVDAVTGEGKNQRMSLSRIEDDALTSIGKIKEETEADDAWKSLPSASPVNVYSKSPLVDKDQSVENSLRQRGRNESSTQPRSDGEQPRPHPSSAISVLLARPGKAKEGIKEQDRTEISLEKALAKLDIYEFNGSSPMEPGSASIAGGKEDRHLSRTSRKLSTTAQVSVSYDDKESLDGRLGMQKMASSSISHRRQSMAVLEAPLSTANRRDHKAGENSLRKSHSNSILTSVVDSSTRNDRVSARRRSMML